MEPYGAILVACGTKAANGNNTLIAAPGDGSRHVIIGYVLQNMSATATTMLLYDDTETIAGFLGQTQGANLPIMLPVGCFYAMGENTALVLNLSGANQCGYIIWYYTEPVFV